MRRVMLFLSLFVFIYESLVCQAVSNQLNVTATVLSPLSIQKTADLQFGEILPGRNKSIVPSNLTSCGKWQITGAASRGVSFTVTLSSNLTSGSNTLPLTFSSTDCFSSFEVGGTSPKYFTVGSSVIENLSSSGRLFVFIGGTITAASNLSGGTYEGVITISVDYTGS